ncbi:tetratricopeptide repeat protein [Paludibacterium purpuratum]|uniref:Putative TPR repeat methyltransferase n=1 Tax=Paludibacterium purpuratum TaxID=1144873 RepID=A0A4R7BC76_9NEIS|nr:tetratricopeptide repeat protein [Paludibacterium purpuratum]TDR82634.1 putative TPR repeat methyltransferase [Paludibacterium purpuratum]
MQIDQQQAEAELAQARSALERNDVPQAEALCTQLLARAPEFAPALHLGSLLLFRQGEMLGAIERMMHAIELDPARADWLNDLGNLLAAHGQPEQAVRFFQHALLLNPENAQVWNNLGAMREKLGETELAGEAFEHAVALDETLVDAWANYANWLTGQGREQDAAECVLRAFVAAPADGQPLVMRGMALARLGRQADAAECYRQHLAANPEDPTALHLYHACLRDQVPTRASNAYIEAKYDDYAETFDSHQAELGYRGHHIVAGAVAVACGQGLRALDLGCGTGLVGNLIAGQCVSLTGIDLSDKMLAHAQATGRYHQLQRAEIIDWLSAHPAQYDLITAADLLIYFGDLTPFLQQTYSALRPGGRLVMTLEALADSAQEYEIQPTGRFRHGEHYADTLLSRQGFDQIDIIPETLRVEGGAPVACWLVTARRPA